MVTEELEPILRLEIGFPKEVLHEVQELWVG